MTLYKNVDIIDLESILTKGILSLDESKNNNWTDGHRAKNPTNIVYMFKPLGDKNVFEQYGAALLEISIDDDLVTTRELSSTDAGNGLYTEYTAAYVSPEQISKIYIPEIFKNYLELSDAVAEKITWCGMAANYYTKDGLQPCTDDVLLNFAATAPLAESFAFNYFRGSNADRTVTDLDNVRYCI